MHWADIGMGAGGFAGTGMIVLPFFRKAAARIIRALIAGVVHDAVESLEKRFDSNDDKTDLAVTGVGDVKTQVSDLNQRVVKIEAQFGPNGGGLREAVNKVQLDVVALKTDVSWLKGKASA